MKIQPTYENGILRIPEGSLVVLSGLPGSGKSFLRNTRCKNVERATWLSTDELRDAINPPLPMVVDGRALLRRNESANEEVYAIIKHRVQAGLRMGRTVVVDATNITDSDRQNWIGVADSLGAPHIVVILDVDLETCLTRAKSRVFHVPEQTIRTMLQPPEPVIPEQVLERAKKTGGKVTLTLSPGFQRTSRFNYHVLTENDELNFTWKELPAGNWDVIGDVHGLLDDLLALLTKAGWSVSDGRLSPHPLNRKILFLGDLVDRGTQSLEVVRFVKRAIEDGLALAIAGNHEAKLVRFVETALKDGIEKWTSYANAETGMVFLRLEANERDSLISFLKRLPNYLVDMESMTVFVHANVTSFTLGSTTVEDTLYGMSGWKPVDSDDLYQQGVTRGVNTLTLVRGHIPQTSVQSHAFSLERHPFQRGELVLMQFDKVSNVFKNSKDPIERIEAFNAALVTQKCEFDFEKYSERYALLKGLDKLVVDKHAFMSRDASGIFRTFKYSKQTFWNNSWDASPLLLKARGIVMDPGGNIVSHPFDKCFNYLENGTGKDIADETTVVVSDKLNGFLGIISAHPLKKGELLVHTQGSFDSDFVNYIKDHLTPTLKGQTLKFLSRNDVTLMFEVIHKDDPHIIEYDEVMQGLHLLGVRGKHQNDQAWTEEAVDEAAAQMGYRRPGWARMTFGEMRTKLRTCRIEGFMVRADTPGQEFLLKAKSPYYLTSKFLARMGIGKVKHMFGNPADFKKTVDEEFYIIVDTLVAAYKMEDFAAMTDDVRVVVVRDLINQLQ
jgi:predicted kinase